MDDTGGMFGGGLKDVKLAFDTIRTLFGVLKDAKEAMPDSPKSEAVTEALKQSEIQFDIAEAQIAKALGYELCKCQFPPSIMLAVGYSLPDAREPVRTIFECPKCHMDTSGPYIFERKRLLK